MSVFIPKTGQGIAKISTEKSTPSNDPVQQGKGDFARLLEQQFQDQAVEKTSSTDPGTLGEIQGAFRPVFDSTASSREDIISQMDQILDMFDEYAGSLENPLSTLKEADALLQRIISQSLGLSSALEEEESDAGSLMQLLNQFITTANVEQLKIERGDYSE